MLREQKKIVIKAIGDMGNRVTAADVASKTGLALHDSNSLLTTIAAETGGHLEVNNTGDIAYRFKNNFQSAYLATGIRAFFSAIGGGIVSACSYLLKISFGIFLVLSIVIVITAFIIFAVLSSFYGERDDFNLFELVDFFNILIFRELIFGPHIYTQQLLGDSDTEAEGGRKKRGNFFVNCFSFLFGEGDPNKHLQEEKWQMAAQAIRENGGVVIKEQLDPYIGPELDDEDSILPLLARFDGRPKVTASGNIVYVFPSMQVTSGEDGVELPNSYESNIEAAESIEAVASRQSYLAEETWDFSRLPARSMMAVKVIAGVNLFGTLWMYYIFNCLFRFNWHWTEVMAIYGALFLIVPMVRFVREAWLNRGIEQRNRKRHDAAQLVSQPGEEMCAKLSERAKFMLALPLRAVDSEHLIFTTEKENLEQQFNEIEQGNKVEEEGRGQS